MPKDKQPLSSRLKCFVSEFGACTFSTDGKVLYCKYCDVKVGSEKRFNVTQHINTDKHKNAIMRKEKTQNTLELKKVQQLVSNSKKSSFNKDLCSAMLSANIPLNKLGNVQFKQFLEKYTGKQIPAITTLRKGYVDEIYSETMNKIRNAITGKKIWVSIDETTDSLGRYIANVVIGTLETDGPGQTFLLNSEILTKANHSTIAKLFDNSMHLLWPEEVRHDDVLLFLSNAAPYMVKSGKSIQIFYPKVIHVTCIVHGLHLIAEKIRANYCKVDKIIANVKKVFLKAPYRIATFKDKAPNIPLPPAPVLTRWGTWIRAAVYYCEHLEIIKSIVDSLDKEDAISIENSQKYFSEASLAANLVFIKSHFGFLPDTIASLEAKNILLSHTIDVMQNVSLKLSQVPGPIGKIVKEKMNDVLKKNIGYQSLIQISNILNGKETSMDELPENLNINDLIYFKYALVNSVDVERSFSMFKVLLADNRQSFQFENLKKHLIVQCNFQGKSIININ